MKKSRRFKGLCFLFAAAMLLPSFLSVRASAVADPDISAPQAICYQLESGKILFAAGENDRIAPASFTKLMTALLAFEYRAASGNPTVTVTEEMLSSAGGNTMNLKAGEVLPFDSLLAGLCVYAANDAALVLASVVGGNIAGFIDRMNERAKALGMTNTYYANPTGVDAPTMTTTLSDTLLLCCALYRVNDFVKLASEEKVTIPATNLTAERRYTNRNAVIPFSYVTDYYIPDARGMIAGYTANAGYCVATLREKNNATTLVLLSGGSDASENQNGSAINTYYDAKTLLEWAEKGFQRTDIITEGAVIREEKIALAAGVDHMILVAGEGLQVFLPKDADLTSADFRQVVTLSETSFQAPVVKGQQFGTVEFYYRDELLGSVPLEAQSNIGRSQWSAFWNGVTRFFSAGPARAILILVLLLAVAYVVILLLTVWVQYLRASRERRRAMRRLEEEEKRRMQTVRRRERMNRSHRIRRAGMFFREGFRVMTGDTDEAPAAPSDARKGRPGRSAAHRGVARVPEKYRKYPQGTAPRGKTPPAKRPASAPPRSQSGKTPTPPAGQGQRAPRQNPAAARPNPAQAKARRPAAKAPARPPQKNSKTKPWPE